jgi:hypothetical protein
VVLWVVFDFTARVFGYACLRKYNVQDEQKNEMLVFVRRFRQI